MKLLFVVIGMMIVTYLPRLLPLMGLGEASLPPRLASFLRYVPIAALGSLIFPSSLYSTGSVLSALAGSLAALTLAFFRLNIVLVVMGAILTVLLMESLLGGPGMLTTWLTR